MSQAPTDNVHAHAGSGLTRKSAVGVAWTLGALGVTEPLHILFTALVAHVLTPDDFGIVGMAAVFLGLGALGNDLGFTVALIQRLDLTRAEIDAVFWLNLIVGAVFTGIGVLVAPALAVLYREPRVEMVFVVLSFSFLLTSLFLVQNALLRRELDFRSPAMASLARVLASGLVSLVCAFYGLGPVSLAIGVLAGIVAAGVVVQVRSRYVPRLGVHLSAGLPLARFGGGVMVGDLGTYAASTVDNLAIGRFLGASALGPYSVAYNLVTYPVRKIARFVASVVLPALSAMQEDTGRLGRAYMVTAAYVSMLVLPALAAAVIVGENLVMGLYGKQWTAAVAPFRVLCLGAAASLMCVFAELILKSMGRAREFATWSVVYAVVLGAGVLVSLPYGTMGVAWAVVVSTAALGLVAQVLVLRLLQHGIFGAIRRLAPAVAASIVAAVAALGVQLGLGALGFSGLLSAVCTLVGSLVLTWLVLRRVPGFGDITSMESLFSGLLHRKDRTGA